MNRTCGFGVRLLGLAVSFSAAYGQGNCTIKTIVGTYAFNSTGAGINTVKPDGTASEKYWFMAAGMDTSPPLNSIPVNATFTVNPDCTGLTEYTIGPYPISEQVLVLDNGNEIRSVATRTAAPTSTCISVTGRAGASLLRFDVAPDGSATGLFMGKFGPELVPALPVAGMLKLNLDCTAEGTQDCGIGLSVARGVFFNEGREGNWRPLVNNLRCPADVRLSRHHYSPQIFLRPT